MKLLTETKITTQTNETLQKQSPNIMFCKKAVLINLQEEENTITEHLDS